MLTLLKQARAFGLGCVLATQNPVDLDYKGLSNTGTWFLGRLQTERDKMRVMEGLEGASAEAGASFDKQAMERTLAGLGSRVFLLNSVHEDRPTVFHTRWAMSYLAGPLARDKIKELMDPLRERFTFEPEEPGKPAEEEAERSEQNEQAEASPEEESETKPSEEQAAAKADPMKLAAAERELEQRESDLNGALLQLPLAGFDVLYRVFDLMQAMQQKRATTRRTSSVRAAAGRGVGRISKVATARSKWSEAYVEHAEASGSLSSRAPIMPLFAWVILAVELIVLLVIIGVAASWLGPLISGEAIVPDAGLVD